MSMFNFDIDDLNVADRMAYIDFKLRFTGSINRSDLHHMFGLAEASASKMMTKYSTLRKQNMHYNAKQRFNEILRDSFSPLLNLSAETALGMLANGFNRNKLYQTPEIGFERAGLVENNLDIEFVERITRAMSQGYAVKCSYFSSHSDNWGERTLLPLTLLFDGRNWIFRAFNRTAEGKGEFKNFNFSRLKKVEELVDEYRKPFEELTHDREWNTQVPLLLVPHDRLTNKERDIVACDYGLQEGKLIRTERAATMWYLKELWLIDDRTDNEYSNELHSYKETIDRIESDSNLNEKEKSEQLQNVRKNFRKYNFRLTNVDMVNAVIDSLKN
ncbi:WYL domain [Vibrio sp. B1FIG11]|uniref:WYL domain-containing protein n=1 Tax=Vibrio sp. B1FIG11 TaxID=2751177 RepID=UPI0015F782FA|nr:WYL domain-containing protein [Vibrio sp. B1FIG11]CAE6883731.1 WYL domain [Vibrio sp. B1FIG11]